MKRFLVVMMLSVVGVANVEAADGNKLLPACESAVRAMDNPNAVVDYYAGYCQGLISGVMDVSNSNSNQPLLRSCPPGNATLGQATRIVTRYLRKHPEQLHMLDTQLVLMAIQATYPCKS